MIPLRKSQDSTWFHEEEDIEAGKYFSIKIVFAGIRFPIVKIRWSYDHLIFIHVMGIPILARQHLYNETTPAGLFSVVKDHLSWETTWFNGRFIEVSLFYSFFFFIKTSNILSSSAASLRILPGLLNKLINSSPHGQNGRHFARCIFVNEKFCILIKISLNFVPEGPIDNNPSLV